MIITFKPPFIKSFILTNHEKSFSISIVVLHGCFSTIVSSFRCHKRRTQMLRYSVWGLVLAVAIFASSASAQSTHPETGAPLVLTCYRGTPNLDGNLDEWRGLEAAAVDVEEQIFLGPETWTGAADCSANFYAMWDDSNIYIAVEAKDEKIVTAQTGGNIWMNDCAEIFFATTNAVAGCDEHYQYGATPNELKWNWCNMDGAGQREPDYAAVKASETADGYAIEFSVEYAQMMSLAFETDVVIGFHPCLDDCDGDGSSRDLQITWTGLEAHDQSTGYGHLVLSSEISTAVSPSGKLATTWSHLKVR
jgi:hypothetical protein